VLAWQQKHNAELMANISEEKRKKQKIVYEEYAYKETDEKSKYFGKGDDADDDFVVPIMQKVKECPEPVEEELKQSDRVRIYFGTRTHRQIAQIVKELRSTVYRPKMSVLGSRDQYCVHPAVSRSSNKNEECNNLLEKDGCRYFDRHKNLIAHSDIKPGHALEVWDIEDLQQLGKKTRGCPYYAARAISKVADIVFCPYQYLIDESTSSSLGLGLKNSIIILDEAHNIEDVCRTACSLEISDAELKYVKEQLEEVAEKFKDTEKQMKKLAYLVDCLLSWAGEKSRQNVSSFDNDTHIFSQSEACEMLHKAGISKQILPELNEAISEILNLQQLAESDNAYVFPKAVERSSRDILNLVKNLLDENKKAADDYKIAIQKNISDENATMTICFWCLNPAVAFKRLTENARSVVLASGTLSPLQGFFTELGCNFKYVVECNHVVGQDQAWISQLSCSPRNVRITGTYTECETFQYQDAIGQSLLQICSAVGAGVLCFVTSYSLLDKLLDRWYSTDILFKLEQIKKIVVEPRDSKGFDDLIAEYYEHINNGGGALFFGVFRGKISEGIDFADDYARAVVTVGLPFPHLKDIKVKLKREYNDHNKKNKLMSGSEWYTVQAYRAYNQALGRCIRHKNDWGAVIMLDSRLGKKNSIDKLPRWVRDRVKCYDKFEDFEKELKQFTEHRQSISAATTEAS
jgi:Fanconi anemia group J protein